jgi:hypothetical protein
MAAREGESLMPLVPGNKRKQDSHLYRLILVKDDRQVIADVGYDKDSLRQAAERNRRLGYEIIIERAEMPQDLEWERVG